MTWTHGRAPDRFIDYVHSLLNYIRDRTGYFFRLITYGTLEPGYWVAYKGYDITQNSLGKFSTTVSPIIDTSQISVDGSHFRFDQSKAWCGMAVSYTNAYFKHYKKDPWTNDYVYVWEMELAFYKRADPCRLLKFELGEKDSFRITREHSLTESELAAQKSLAVYIEGVPRSRRRDTYFRSDYQLARLIYLLYLLQHDVRISSDFAEAWDRYFQEEDYHGVQLNAVPAYEEKQDWTRGRKVFLSNLSIIKNDRPRTMEYVEIQGYIEKTLKLAPDVHGRILPFARRIAFEFAEFYDVQDELDKYYYSDREQGYIGMTLGRPPENAYTLFYRYPDVFDSVEEATAFLKMYPVANEEAIMQYKEVKKAKKMGQVVWADYDPSVIPED